MRQTTTMDRPAKKPTERRGEQDRLDGDREAIAGGDDDLTDDEPLDELEDDEDYIDEGDEEEEP